MKRGLLRSLSGSSGRSKEDPISVGYPLRDDYISSKFNKEDPFSQPLISSRDREEPISKINPYPEPLTFSRIRPSDAVDEQPPNTFTYKLPQSPGGSSITKFSYKLSGSPSGSTHGSEGSSITKTFNITLKENPRARPEQKAHTLPNCLKPRNASPGSSPGSSPERAFRIKSPCPQRKPDNLKTSPCSRRKSDEFRTSLSSRQKSVNDDARHNYQHHLSSSNPMSAPPIHPSSLRDIDLLRDNYKYPRSISENGDNWNTMTLPRSYRKALNSDPSYDKPRIMQLPLPRSRNPSAQSEPRSRTSSQELIESMRSRNSSGQSKSRRGSREEPAGASRRVSEESQASSLGEKRVIRSRPGSHEYVRRISYEDTIGENVVHQLTRPRRGSDPYSNDISINEVSRFNERFSETGTSSEGSDDAFRAQAMPDLSLGDGRGSSLGDGRGSSLGDRRGSSLGDRRGSSLGEEQGKLEYRARTLSDLSDERIERRRRAGSDGGGAMSDIGQGSPSERRRAFSRCVIFSCFFSF